MVGYMTQLAIVQLKRNYWKKQAKCKEIVVELQVAGK